MRAGGPSRNPVGAPARRPPPADGAGAAQCAGGAGTSPRREYDAGAAQPRGRRAVRPGRAARPHRDLRQQPHPGNANALGRDGRRGAGGLPQGPVPQVQHQAGRDRRRLRDDARGAHRRFARAQEEDPDRDGDTWPDLVLLDGGRGQLNAAKAVLEDLGIEDVCMVGIAKGPHHGREGREVFHLLDGREFQLPVNSPVLFYLQRLRDEVHRFAIGAHREKRAKAIGASPLDEVPGIGPARKKALLMHFGTGRAVRNASLGGPPAGAGGVGGGGAAGLRLLSRAVTRGAGRDILVAEASLNAPVKIKTVPIDGTMVAEAELRGIDVVRACEAGLYAAIRRAADPRSAEGETPCGRKMGGGEPPGDGGLERVDGQARPTAGALSSVLSGSLCRLSQPRRRAASSRLPVRLPVASRIAFRRPTGARCPDAGSDGEIACGIRD